MPALCGWYGISRQAHDQMLERQQQQQMVDELVIVLVQEVRRRHPRMGVRKLLHVLAPQLEQAGVAFGRDRFFELLAQYDLLVPCHRQRRRTTWPGAWRCPNRLAGLVVSQVQQVWVCEFNFRDAKQFWGLEDFMNISPTAVTNAASLSLFMVNFSHRLLRTFRQTDQADSSILDL